MSFTTNAPMFRCPPHTDCVEEEERLNTPTVSSYRGAIWETSHCSTILGEEPTPDKSEGLFFTPDFAKFRLGCRQKNIASGFQTLRMSRVTFFPNAGL